jgi:hypothetical protein
MKRRDLDPEAQQFANTEGVQVRRVRRIPPRLPTGTVLVRDLRGAKTCMRMIEARFPSPAERLMAKHLCNLVDEVEHATLAPHTVRAETLQALEAAYDAAFPWPNWFPWFFEYLQRARIAWYDWETAGLATPDHVLEVGRAVLRWTRDALSDAIVFCPLLPRWLVPELVALLLQRFSFGRGGGPDRALSHDRMRELLLHPPKMAKYLRSLQGGEKRFRGVLAELERAPSNVFLDECVGEGSEAVPTLQHTIKAGHLRSLADEVETACGDPALLLLPERRDALHRAYAAKRPLEQQAPLDKVAGGDSDHSTY